MIKKREKIIINGKSKCVTNWRDLISCPDQDPYNIDSDLINGPKSESCYQDIYNKLLK